MLAGSCLEPISTIGHQTAQASQAGYGMPNGGEVVTGKDLKVKLSLAQHRNRMLFLCLENRGFKCVIRKPSSSREDSPANYH